MTTLVQWLLPILLSVLGNMVDAWAQNAEHIGGAVGMIASIWLALRLQAPKKVGTPSPVDRTFKVDRVEAPKEDEDHGWIKDSPG